jgi:GNAT superfamily N-acetyltransferase
MEIEIRKAEREDLPAIIGLFADDLLGGHGDTTEPEAFGVYLSAFEKITASAHQTLFVACIGDEVVGTFQTAVSTSLPGRGSSSLVIEAVQTREDMRGRGIGARMIRHAIAEARERVRRKCGSPPMRFGSTRIASTNASVSNAVISASRRR